MAKAPLAFACVFNHEGSLPMPLTQLGVKLHNCRIAFGTENFLFVGSIAGSGSIPLKLFHPSFSCLQAISTCRNTVRHLI